MRIPKLVRTYLICVLSLMLSHLPNVAFAESMIPTHVAVAEMSRAEQELQLEQYLNQDDVKATLAAHGYSADEIKSRVSSLSDTEMNQLSTQMQQARYGGLLIEILLVVLIIFLVKRI